MDYFQLSNLFYFLFCYESKAFLDYNEITHASVLPLEYVEL